MRKDRLFPAAACDVNKGITSITYNVLNLPWVITAGPNRTITYTYDAAGNKLTKVTNETNVNFVYGAASYTTGIITTTIYIGGYVYQNKVYTNATLMALLNTAPLSTSDALQYLAHEEGRARIVYLSPITANFAFDYFIRDNLGNVRATVTDEPQTGYYPAATLETTGNSVTPLNAVASEKRFYNIIDGNIVATQINGVPAPGMSWYSTAIGNSYLNNNGLSNPNPDALTINPTVTSNSLYKLPANGGTYGTDHTGLGITLKVTTGDLINIYGKSVWHSSGSSPVNTNYLGLTSTMLAFLNAFTGTGAVIDGSKGIATGTVLNNTTATTGPLGTWLQTGVASPAGTPKAGFNYILFDEQFKPVATLNAKGFIPVKATPDDVQSFSVGSSAGGTINIPQSGYLYVYVSNESNQDVYFDNFQVVQARSQLIDEKHYYPGGLAMTGIGSSSYGKLSNAYGYQGKEMQAGEYYDGTGLEEYDFAARYYDQQLMRWHNQDPAGQFASPYLAMGNNWARGKDPDGKWLFIDDFVINFVAGFFSGGGNIGQRFSNAWNQGVRGVENAGKLYGGLFKGNLGQIISRFTWELPQTIAGLGVNEFLNTNGFIQDVNYFDGATVARGYGHSQSAFTLGSYIHGDETIRADPSNVFFQHEYGHYLQSQKSGPLYLTKYAIPSLIKTAFSSNANHFWVEQDANRRAFAYWNKTISGYSDWDPISNPIDPGSSIRDPRWWEYGIGSLNSLNSIINLFGW